ncbi:hypothetical protein [Actinoplanes sp. HUAS TT8]|uniref:hypothetical protein n=1 Tax=Actinoplanes sp. HUAS TT8 TaxID=3447453 RepID=UPI003F52868B
MTRTGEGVRIFHGPRGAPQGALRRFVGKTDRQAQASLDRCKELLIAVTHWIPPRDARPARVEDWKARTPEWFVRACAPVPAEEELRAGRALDEAGKAHHRAEQPWTFADWIGWFDHSSGRQRSWRWWDGGIDDDSDFWIDVEVVELPTEAGALTWMMRAAGARNVVEAGSRDR